MPVYKEFYGQKLLSSGNDFQDELRAELDCFTYGLTEERGGLGKYGHFMNIVNLLWNNPDLHCRKQYIHNSWAEKFFRLACEERYLAVAGCASAGKCCKSDTYILFHDGTRRQAKDVKVGDLLMGDDGQPRKVLETHSGTSQLYKVTPKQGDPWECTGEHVLSLKRTYAPVKGWRRVGEIRDISVHDYLASSATFKNQNRMFCVGVDFPEQPAPLDPRMYGIWLGDGHINNPRLSIDDAEVEELQYVSAWAEANNYHFRRHAPGRCVTCPSYFLGPKDSKHAKDNLFYSLCIGGMVDGEKRIDPRYLTNSRQVRLELLAGLLDTDGHASGTYFEIATQYAGLKDDIVYLARSLGMRVAATHRMASIGEKKYPSWRINIIGNVQDIPTLRKKCKERERGMPDCMAFKIEPTEVGDWVGFSVDGNHRHLLGDFTVTHNSDPAALWAIVNYLADPTHTKVIVMSTTLKGAKLRIWKTMTEYWSGLSQAGTPPGKALWSNNMIRGPSYDFAGLSDAAGIQLLASEQSKEKESLEKIIGIKAPKTDGRRGRDGKLIVIIDEMTGCSESILHAAYANLDSNTNFQMIGLGNPNSLFDTFGLFCEPKDGWDSVKEDDTEWDTKRGTCLRLDAQYNPRIIEGDEKLTWMPTQEKIKQAIDTYGAKSLFFNRMFRAVFTKEGEGNTIYTASDFISSKAFDLVTWGHEAPINVAFLDPSFTEGGDRCILAFGKYGIDASGKPVLYFTDYENLQVDASSQEVPHNYQIARQFRDKCIAHGVKPENAGFDCTGGGGPFGDIVTNEWSSAVKKIMFGGQASNRPVSHVNKTPSREFYANRVAEIWYGAKHYMASGYIKGFRHEVAKEICQREIHRNTNGESTRKLQIESKVTYKSRVNSSPDLGDAALGLVELCRINFAFKRPDNYVQPISIFTEPGELRVPAARPAHSKWREFTRKNQLPNPQLFR